MYEVDPLEPAVEFAANRFSLSAGLPDISGNWEYTCTSYDGLKIWGGNARFRVSKERFGEVVHVSGERTWEGHTNISPPIAWNTDGGVIVSDGQIQWHYFTHVGDRSEGFTQVSLQKRPDGSSVREGRFSEISKKDPKYGNIEISRR
jgi:hypothetical protein